MALAPFSRLRPPDYGQPSSPRSPEAVSCSQLRLETLCRTAAQSTAPMQEEKMAKIISPRHAHHLPMSPCPPSGSRLRMTRLLVEARSPPALMGPVAFPVRCKRGAWVHAERRTRAADQMCVTMQACHRGLTPSRLSRVRRSTSKTSRISTTNSSPAPRLESPPASGATLAA
jgi:hypothetical protein